MKLTELEPRFMKYVDDSTSRFVDNLAEASGVLFCCPLCFTKNGGNVGTHYVLAWFRDRGVPDAATPGPGRWAVTGSGLADLTLAPSIHLTGPGCGWHGFVTAGEVT